MLSSRSFIRSFVLPVELLCSETKANDHPFSVVPPSSKPFAQPSFSSESRNIADYNNNNVLHEYQLVKYLNTHRENTLQKMLVYKLPVFLFTPAASPASSATLRIAEYLQTWCWHLTCNTFYEKKKEFWRILSERGTLHDRVCERRRKAPRVLATFAKEPS